MQLEQENIHALGAVTGTVGGNIISSKIRFNNYTLDKVVKPISRGGYTLEVLGNDKNLKNIRDIYYEEK